MFILDNFTTLYSTKIIDSRSAKRATQWNTITLLVHMIKT